MPAASSDPNVTTSTIERDDQADRLRRSGELERRGERSAGQRDLVPVGLEVAAASSRTAVVAVGMSSIPTVNDTSTYMTLPSGATAWADRVGHRDDVLRACATGAIAVSTSWMPVPARNDSPSGAATTTRALEVSPPCWADMLLSDPTSAAWSPSRSATSACARSDSVPGIENELEMFSPDAMAPKAAAASTSSHATSTIQRWR